MNNTLSYRLNTFQKIGMSERIFYFIEKIRLQLHLSKVERELRSKNIDYMSIKLMERRETHIQHLHTYWIRGLFPRNTDYVTKTPLFRDNYGTPCAMAYLIQDSGCHDLVDSVSQMNNRVYINDITGGPVLDWIQNSGLTQAEAARIQPAYPPCGFEPTAMCLLIQIIKGILSFIILPIGTFIGLMYVLSLHLPISRKFIKIPTIIILSLIGATFVLAILQSSF